MSVAKTPKIDYELQGALLESAIAALRSDPENQWLLADVAELLRPWAKNWGFKISICGEDWDDAQSMILEHLLQAALPASHRRLGAVTKRPLAGYPAGADAGSFFTNAAKHKAFDILKGRRRAWRRECTIMQPLFNYAELLSAGVGSQAGNAEINRYAGTHGATA